MHSNDQISSSMDIQNGYPNFCEQILSNSSRRDVLVSSFFELDYLSELDCFTIITFNVSMAKCTIIGHGNEEDKVRNIIGTISKGRLPSLVFQIVVEEVKNGVILFFHSVDTYMKQCWYSKIRQICGNDRLNDKMIDGVSCWIQIVVKLCKKRPCKFTRQEIINFFIFYY